MLCLAIYRAVDPEDGDVEEREEEGEEFDCNSEKVSGFFLLSVTTSQCYQDHKYLVWH